MEASEYVHDHLAGAHGVGVAVGGGGGEYRIEGAVEIAEDSALAGRGKVGAVGAADFAATGVDINPSFVEGPADEIDHSRG